MDSAAGFTRIREWTEWGTSGGVLETPHGPLEWTIPSMAHNAADAAVALLMAAYSEEQTLSHATAALASWTPLPHVLQVTHLRDGVILVDDTATTAPREAVASLKTVTSVAARQRRVIVVAGALAFDGDSDYDSLGAYGALMVRLNVNQVFAVGADARALFLSVGMEGSWDGESQHCLTIDDAYDDVRAFIRPDDVVLVMGSLGVSLRPVVERLERDLS